jgi:hypothetical protein
VTAVAGRLDVEGEVWIEVTTTGAIGAYDDVDGARVLPRALPATDVVWTALDGRIEELRVVRSKESPTVARDHVRFGSAITDARVRDGAIELLDAAGVARIVSPRPFAIDARGVRRDAEMAFARTTDGIDVEARAALLHGSHTRSRSRCLSNVGDASSCRSAPDGLGIL